MGEERYKRQIKIIKAGLQLKLVATFVGLSALSSLLMTLLLGFRLTNLSGEMPSGQYLIEALPRVIFEILLISFGLILPLTFAVGVLATHRIAGPVHHFETYLRRVSQGQATGPCKIRKGDELQELCAIINEVTRTLRQDPVEKPSQDDGEAFETVRIAG
ncbi:MAG: hypothetical protein O7B99_08915 [Planctomycetota bacterium]|nr:hypothetical protein [Planctomycetota bacterium]